MAEPYHKPLLDHGYVRLVEYWGSDERIIESARMSTSGAFRRWGPYVMPCLVNCNSGTSRTPQPSAGDPDVQVFLPCKACDGRGYTEEPGDEKLLRYLWENAHHTPFEMCGLTFEIQAPIFVFRQWMRHRTQSYNELSARYTTLPDLFYVPSVERLMNSAKAKKGSKQGSGIGISEAQALVLRGSLQTFFEQARTLYEKLQQAGMANEMARLVIPVSQYSKVRASANLRNWLGFLKLRMDSHAQWEIQQYANAIAAAIRLRFPRTYEIWQSSQ